MGASEARQTWRRTCQRLWTNLGGRLDRHEVYSKHSKNMTNAFSGELAERWPEFVQCETRLETLGTLLEKNIPKDARILDAAAGTGCDAGWLVRHGYDVTANEVSAVMRKKFSSEFGKSGHAHVTSVDWFDFSSAFRRREFNTLLLLGNTLCLLPDKSAMQLVIRNFNYVLSGNGRIIADERNFRFILENPKFVLSANFRYPTDTMYCGTSIYAKPIDVRNQTVTFGYFDAGNDRIIGTLDMYAFGRDELAELFREQGFQLSATYSDLKPEFNPSATFYTYVFDRRA
jgi:SAM-dependent methyltransferase